MKIRNSHRIITRILMVLILLPTFVFSLESISFTENTSLLLQQKTTSKEHEVTLPNSKKDKSATYYTNENIQNRSKANLINDITQKERRITLLLKKQNELAASINKNTSIYALIILALCICFVFSFLYQYRKAKCYHTHLKKLIEERSNAKIIENQHIQKTTTPNNVINVPEKQIAYIIKKLEEFENQKQYLTPGLSAHSLADHIKTNVKYLSQVIKYSKNKTFSSYINELRITYATTKIRENSKFRKYTIKAIANEMGYGSAETFSNAFHKQVGIKPSCFIRSFNK